MVTDVYGNLPDFKPSRMSVSKRSFIISRISANQLYLSEIRHKSTKNIYRSKNFNGKSEKKSSAGPSPCHHKKQKPLQMQELWQC